MLKYAAALLLIASGSAFAQDDPAEMKKKILEKVKARLEEEHKRIMERIGRIVDEELKETAQAPVPAPVKPDKKLRDLERELAKLDDKRDDLLAQIRGEKRKTEDAKLIEAAKDAATKMNMQEAKENFDAGMKAHEAKDFKSAIPEFKKIYYMTADQPQSVGHQSLGIPSAYNVACGYALDGNKEQALDWLEICIKAGYKNYEHMRKDSDLDSLRKERRYLRLMEDN